MRVSGRCGPPRSGRRISIFAALLVACAAADESAPSDRGQAGGSSAQSTEAGPADARASEAGPADAGASDAGRSDAGRQPDAGDGASPTSPMTDAAGPAPHDVRLPPIGAGFDYQLGGAYAPPSGVMIVARDRESAPAAGLYNICYVNGFQAQDSEKAFWLDEQPDLILRDAAGNPVIDRDWDEMLLDVSTPDKRTRLAAIAGRWIEGCAAAGFDAVEIDNLDSFSRSGGRLEDDHAVAYMQLLSQAAHAHGLAIAQKNSAELVPRRAQLGTDFVVSEECNHYDECDDYRAGYGDHLLMIEYVRSDFEKGCAAHPGLSIVLRDRDLVSAGKPGYVFERCK